ncbi:hypothetical protein [Tuwongella immobilis]|uniref:Uncharacterized protein n=1 Tax=Tuwongella immobilis TaxID=692036 RepID=A0A6C2YQ77_9BACT|nr:hypothetical protein [Tuwongella immobilis]VIP03329.1 unnamed protein product [Tuwongella immobilis]VTS04029.1 unnamed protein product [Tuwongella immobilis]
MTKLESLKSFRDHVRWELRCLWPYSQEASLWAALHDHPMLTQLHHCCEVEHGIWERIETWLQQQSISVEPLGPFPSRFSGYNFVNLRAILPLLRSEAEVSKHAWDRWLREADPAVAEPVRHWLTDLDENRQRFLASIP